MVENLPDNAGVLRDVGLILRLGRSLKKEMAIRFSTLAWKIPQKEEAGGLQSMGLLRVRHD